MLREIKDSDRIFLYELLKKEFNVKYTGDSIFCNWIIYEVDNTIIGFINYDLIYENAEIDYIYVEKKYRMKNIASKMIEYMWKKLKKEDIHSVSLEVNCNNIPAINFYKKHGFIIKAIREKYYGKDDAYLMIKVVK